MLEFPGLIQEKDSIRLRYKLQLELAENFYEFWMKWPKSNVLTTSSLDNPIISVLMGLQHQICRFFKTIIEVTEKGEAFCGLVMCRSMLESLFIVQFLCKENWQVWVRNSNRNKDIWNISAVTNNTPSAEIHRYAREIRALLYVAQIAFDDVKLAKRNFTDPGLREIATNAKKRIDQTFIRSIETELDPCWIYVLKNKTDFCGMNLAEFAKSLEGFSFSFYEVLYPVLSRVAHGKDAHRNLRVDEITQLPKLSLFSDSEEIQTVLYFTTTFLFSTVNELSILFDFGEEFKSKFDEFKDIYSSVYGSETAADSGRGNEAGLE